MRACGPRHVALTSAGEALAEEARLILAAVERADRRLRGFAAADGGAIRLGAVPSAMASLVPAALEALRAERPRVELRLEEAGRATSRRAPGAASWTSPSSPGPASC
jgi:DNA-binding transcriptional LysR family regulator